MLKRLSIALAIFFAMTSAAAADTSITSLNQLINLLRLHTGIMTGPVKYAYVDSEGYKTKVEFGQTKKGERYIRLQVASTLVSDELVRGAMQEVKTRYVATYEDRGPDGILDKVNPMPVLKKDSRYIRILHSNAKRNQEKYDKIIQSIILDLQSAPVL